jgi:hypothetical protein
MIGYTDLSVEELLSILQAVWEANGKAVSGIQFLDAEGRNVTLSRVVVNHDAEAIHVSILPVHETYEHRVERLRNILSPDMPESSKTLKRNGSTTPG